MGKKRNLSIEFLRIISMLLIVYHHFSVHSEWIFPEEQFSKRELLIQTVGNFGKIGVMIFALISGYFLVNQTFGLKKIFSFTNLIRFYTLISFYIWKMMNPSATSIQVKENFWGSLFPIFFHKYWFVNAYFVLLLVQPILKPFFQSQPRKKQLQLFLVFIFFFSLSEITGTLLNIEGFYEPSQTFSILIVAFGGNVLRLYEKELHGKLFKYIISIFLITLILIVVRPIIVFYFGEKFAFSNSFLIGMNSINAILFSMSFFIIITKLNMDSSKWIQKISKLTFDVYLIHDNYIMRPVIWTILFKNASWLSSDYLLLIVIFEPIIVFIFCLMFGEIRTIIFFSFHELKNGISKLKNMYK